jgi:hypothetical protein
VFIFVYLELRPLFVCFFLFAFLFSSFPFAPVLTPREVRLPQQPPSHVSHTLSLVPSLGAQSITLSDILFGYVYVCSGQSNMQLQVGATVNCTKEAQDAARIGKMGNDCSLDEIPDEISSFPLFPFFCFVSALLLFSLLGVRVLSLPQSDAYCNQSVPQTNFTPQQPWALADAKTVWDFSAVRSLGFFFSFFFFFSFIYLSFLFFFF